jgi:hypothetical protein
LVVGASGESVGVIACQPELVWIPEKSRDPLMKPATVVNPWYEMYPQNSIYFNEPTEAGDSMTATVVHDSGTSYTLTLADPTQNWSRTFNASLDGAQDATAEVIMERLTDGVDNFGSMTFTGCDLDGSPFGNSSTNQYVLTDNSNNVQVTTGALNGDQFGMTWQQS